MHSTYCETFDKCWTRKKAAIWSEITSVSSEKLWTCYPSIRILFYFCLKRKREILLWMYKLRFINILNWNLGEMGATAHVQLIYDRYGKLHFISGVVKPHVNKTQIYSPWHSRRESNMFTILLVENRSVKSDVFHQKKIHIFDQDDAVCMKSKTGFPGHPVAFSMSEQQHFDGSLEWGCLCMLISKQCNVNANMISIFITLDEFDIAKNVKKIKLRSPNIKTLYR